MPGATGETVVHGFGSTMAGSHRVDPNPKRGATDAAPVATSRDHFVTKGTAPVHGALHRVRIASGPSSMASLPLTAPRQAVVSSARSPTAQGVAPAARP